MPGDGAALLAICPFAEYTLAAAAAVAAGITSCEGGEVVRVSDGVSGLG